MFSIVGAGQSTNSIHELILILHQEGLKVLKRATKGVSSCSYEQSIIAISTRINEDEPLEPQIATLIDAADQSAPDWPKRDILINPPGYAPAALLLLAVVHGRIGHFPTLIRMRPKHASVTTYQVIELLNLQTTRDPVRKTNNT